MTADEETKAMDMGSSEIRFLFDRHGVSGRVQAILFHYGATDMGKFSVFFKDDDDLRVVAKDDLDIDPTTSLKARSELAGVIISYHQAKTRTDEVDKFAGELDARRQLKPLLSTEYSVMKHAFETKYHKLDDCETPARSYLEKKIAELESGELKAEHLRAVLDKDQDIEETWVPTWDTTGTMKMKRSTMELDDPLNPEELRKRVTLLIHGLCFISLQHTSRSEIRGISPDLAGKYLSYLLGDEVWMFVARDEEGRTVSTPNWALVINYELQIRRRALKLVYDDAMPFPDALRSAWKDTVVKNRFFVTPLAIASATGSKKIDIGNGAKRPHEINDDGQQWKTPRQDDQGGRNGKNRGGGGKGQGQGKGRGQGRGRGRGGGGKGQGKGGKNNFGGGGGGKGVGVPQGCAKFTPSGEPICYGYNCHRTRCRNPSCSFTHVCGFCFNKHPLYQCNGKSKWNGPSPGDGAPGPETKGSGGK